MVADGGSVDADGIEHGNVGACRGVARTRNNSDDRAVRSRRAVRAGDEGVAVGEHQRIAGKLTLEALNNASSPVSRLGAQHTRFSIE